MNIINRTTKCRSLLSGLCMLLAQSACAGNTANPRPHTASDFPESLVSATEAKPGIRAAWYDAATERYAHAVLGDGVEAGALHVQTTTGKIIGLTLRPEHVFEDLAPRLADVNGDGLLDVVTIRSHRDKGAQIAVYSLTKTQPQTLTLIANTPYIGTRFRWLAPIGVADFNSDGRTDIAYIDRPHLAKQLKIWSYTKQGLTLLAKRPGLTNHRIGEDFISGGVQRCNGRNAMITVDANWSNVMRTYFEQGSLITERIAPFNGQDSLTKALACTQ